MIRVLAAAGLATVLVMTAVMLFTANAYISEYPSWAWAALWIAAIGLGANAVIIPRNAFSIPAIIAASIIGLALTWPVATGGDKWWPAWLVIGVAMPLLGCWLLRSFSLAFCKS